MTKQVALLITTLLFRFTPAVAQVQQPLSGTSEEKGAAPGGTSLFANGISQFTGQVQFSLPIVSIGGKGALSYSLNAGYSSLVYNNVSTWNREAPTSVLGLGWSLESQRIVADHKNTVNRDDDDFYFVGGGGQMELIYDGMDGSSWKFYTKPYQFWKIRYNPSIEQWTVTKEDGTRLLFGGNVPRKTIQYMVGVRDWIGNTNQSSGGALVAHTWDLSQIVDLFDDAITFEYIHDVGGLAGMSHTRASYLHRITNTIGEAVVLLYQQKMYAQNLPGIREYQDPHTEVNEADAFQELFESKFLDKVVRYNELGENLGEIRFGYQFLGADEMAKRLFSSYTTIAHTGEQLVNYLFQYELVNAPDKNFGALTKVTLPTSGYVSYSYAARALGGVNLEALVSEVSDYREPKAWFGGDYVVISRRKTPGGAHSLSPMDVILDAFTWESGGWIQQNLGVGYGGYGGTLLSVNKKDATKHNPDDHLYDQDFQLVTGKDFFATLHRVGSTDEFRLQLFSRDEGTAGQWNQEPTISMNRVAGAYAPYINLGDEPRLLAGDEFVVVAAAGGNHFAFVKNGGLWTPTSFTKPSGLYAYGAGHNYVIATNVNTDPDATKVYYLDKSNAWIEVTMSLTTHYNSLIEEEVRWTCGSSSAVLVGRSGIFNHSSTVTAISWNPGFQGPTLQQLWSDLHSTYKYPTAIPGSDNIFHIMFPGYAFDQNGYKLHGGISFALVGTTWVSSGSMDYHGPDFRSLFSFGEDFVIRPVKIGSVEKTRVRVFNRNAGTWPQTDLERPRTIRPIGIIAGQKYFVSGGLLYYKNTDGSFIQGTQSIGFLSSNDYLPLEPGPDFVSASEGSFDPPETTASVFIKNGQFVGQGTALESPEIGGVTYAQIISDIYGSPQVEFLPSPQVEFLPSPQVGGNTVVTYLKGGGSGYFMSTAKLLKVHRKVDNRITNFDTDSLRRHVVSGVSVHEGVSATDHKSWFYYSYGTARLETSGSAPQFNSVRVIPGSDAPTPPSNGYTISKFFAGVVPGDYAIPPNIARRLVGMQYKAIQYNSAGSEVAQSQLLYSVLNGQGNSFFVRQFSTQETIDGKKSQSTISYNSSNGMPSLIITTSLDQSYPPVWLFTENREFHYWFEEYDPLRARWILSPQIVEKVTRDGVLQQVGVTRFMSWGPNNIPLPWQRYQWRRAGSGGFTDWHSPSIPSALEWKLTGSVDVYDSRGLPTMQTSGGVSNAIIYDPLRPRVVAEFHNAPSAYVQYYDFEAATSGTSSEAFLGKRSSTEALQVTPLSIPSRLTYWSKAPGGDWTPNFLSISSATTIGGGGILIDEVRVHPLMSFGKSTTYDRFGNITAELDANNRVVYYEYDSFHRLKLTRDQNKYIVKHFFTSRK